MTNDQTSLSQSEQAFVQQLPDILKPRVLRHWRDWLVARKSAAEQSDNPLLIDDGPVADNPVALEQLAWLWGCSEFFANTMIRYPDLWFNLLAENALNTPYSEDDYRQQLTDRLVDLDANDDALLMKALRQFRQQQMLRIAWRDLCQRAETSETLRNLTELADVCVDVTLETTYQVQCAKLGVPCDRQGKAQRMVVLGMGKLGGYELNFSSDIDLIFCYGEEGETRVDQAAATRTMASSQFFIRLGQRLIKLLDDVTADGFVFRVDMRLRPYGDSGPLAMSQDGMEHYYQTQGRDWERYAMIKARVIVGDQQAGQAIMRMLKPFVYRRYLDFGAFESIREMKSMIDAEIRRKGSFQNIKLGLGGIREIEFIGQTFQLIRGGGDPELQIRSIVEILNRLAKKQYLDEEEANSLLLSYDFLRRLENRLQMYADAQTHLMPDDDAQQASIALAMGFDSWKALQVECDQQRKNVHASFFMLLHEEKVEGAADAKSDVTEAHLTEQLLHDIWLQSVSIEDVEHQLQVPGLGDKYRSRLLEAEGVSVLEQLQQFRQSSAVKSMTATARQRLDTLMPSLLSALLEQQQSAVTLQRIIKLLQSVVRRSVYLSLLNEYPSALNQLVKLCAASPWIAHLLSLYPVLLDELLDPVSLYQHEDGTQLKQELDDLIQQVEDDEEQQIERLRKFKQAKVLKIAAMDVAGVLSVFEVSDQLSLIAEVLLDKVKQLACNWMQQKYGKARCLYEGEECWPELGIVAYGKMGGMEMGYGSDLDLVFLHTSQGEQQQSDGERSLDNASYFARLAQRIIHLLGTQTANGRLYEIDMRLRPDGNAGMLVSSLQAYETYQSEKAWTWEHQALVRARILCSGTHLKSEFDRIRGMVLMRPRDQQALKADVQEMRLKMRESLGSKPGSQGFHIKQDAGGLVDIEFIAQYGVLTGAAKFPALLKLTATRHIIRQMADMGLLTDEQADLLIEAYRTYREYSHQLALQDASSEIDKNPVEALRQQVKVIWSALLE